MVIYECIAIEADGCFAKTAVVSQSCDFYTFTIVLSLILHSNSLKFSFQGNYLMQILNVAAFAVSGYSSTKSRTCKPFNPLLGETYEADYPDKAFVSFLKRLKLEISNFRMLHK